MKRARPSHAPRQPRLVAARPRKGHYLVDFFNLSEVRHWRKATREILTFYWDYYAALLHQRSGIAAEIRGALAMAIDGPFRFKKWQRVVDYRFSMEPLSARGSVIADPGGRFNIGDIAPDKLPPFPALYLAEDVDTAFFERFAEPNEKTEGLSALDLALVREDSIALLGVSGQLDSIIDVRDEKRLEPFVRVISKVKVPPELVDRAKRLEREPLAVIRSARELVKALMIPEWRQSPMQVDIPAASQIFAQLAVGAGAEGILFASSKTKKPCLAIFPQNLADTSFVELDGAAPPGVERTRLDGTNWRNFI